MLLIAKFTSKLLISVYSFATFLFFDFLSQKWRGNYTRQEINEKLTVFHSEIVIIIIIIIVVRKMIEEEKKLG